MHLQFKPTFYIPTQTNSTSNTYILTHTHWDYLKRGRVNDNAIKHHTKTGGIKKATFVGLNNCLISHSRAMLKTAREKTAARKRGGGENYAIGKLE
jgi:hypothetical protein